MSKHYATTPNIHYDLSRINQQIEKTYDPDFLDWRLAELEGCRDALMMIPWWVRTLEIGLPDGSVVKADDMLCAACNRAYEVLCGVAGDALEGVLDVPSGSHLKLSDIHIGDMVQFDEDENTYCGEVKGFGTNTVDVEVSGAYNVPDELRFKLVEVENIIRVYRFGGQS